MRIRTPSSSPRPPQLPAVPAGADRSTGRDGWQIARHPHKSLIPKAAGVAQLVEQLIRNQQVSGSSPLAGSNRINNLQGFGWTGNFGCVGTMWANAPHITARAGVARQHRERPRATPPLSRLGGRCPPFDRVWPSPLFGRAPDVRRPPPPYSPGTSRHCRSGGIPRLRGQHQRRDGGSVGTGQRASTASACSPPTGCIRGPSCKGTGRATVGSRKSPRRSILRTRQNADGTAPGLMGRPNRTNGTVFQGGGTASLADGTPDRRRWDRLAHMVGLHAGSAGACRAARHQTSGEIRACKTQVSTTNRPRTISNPHAHLVEVIERRRHPPRTTTAPVVRTLEYISHSNKPSVPKPLATDLDPTRF